MTRRMPNCCVLLIPEGPDRARFDAAVRRAAALVGGTPVAMPHLTVAYLYDVTPGGRAAYARSLEPFARTVPPADVIVEEAITWWSLPYEGLLYIAQRTPALAALYDGLAHLARTLDVLCNPSVEYRSGTMSPHPEPVPAQSWVPHVKVLATFDGDREAAAPLLRPLAPDLSFRARSLRLSYLNEDGHWALGQRFALRGERP